MQHRGRGGLGSLRRSPRPSTGLTQPPRCPPSCSPGITRVTVVLPTSACAVACLGTEGGAVYFLALPALVLLEDKTLFPDEILQR